MTIRANDRVCFFNGKIVPESEVLIPFRDRGFILGDAVYDTERTFGHKIFRLKEHIDRLYRSLRYLQIDPGLSPAEMTAITEDVVERNLHLIDRDEDYWISQRISRGYNKEGRWAGGEFVPTVIVECENLPFQARAPMFRDGIDVIVASGRRTAPDMLSPRAKTHNYLNFVMADLEMQGQSGHPWAVLLDAQGNISEGMGCNFFMVRDGVLMTPRERNVLPGISRAVTMELAEKIGVPLQERDIDMFDAYTAEEAFLTSTSLCICPVGTINRNPVANKSIPGPVTKRLMEAYSELLGFDFHAQYMRRLERPAAAAR
ncbi:MAG: aminotransferase class IV [Dongiaceae bacterium]